MGNSMIYTSVTTAPVIDTIFVNGIKFDICEIIKECYDMLDSKKSRFFVVVEDSFIYGENIAADYAKVTGESRWGFFCKTKAECVSYINSIEKEISTYIEYTKKSKKKGFGLYSKHADKISNKIKLNFGLDDISYC